MMNALSAGSAGALSAGVQRRVKDLVYKNSGIFLEDGKDQLVESRLRRRQRAVGIESADQYLAFLEDEPAEYEHFINAFTTNETSFFRTARVWRYIEQQLIPQWAEDCSTKRKAWSAASSTGEEAYSLAMASHAYNTENNTALKLAIRGSDISTAVVEKAREAVYQGRTINRLKASRPDALLSYFVARDEQYSLLPCIANAVDFSQHNLFQAQPASVQYDLVMLRNVLIYFKDSDQEKVLANIYQALRPGGVLIIGESESLTNLTTNFQFCEPLIYKKPS